MLSDNGFLPTTTQNVFSYTKIPRTLWYVKLSGGSFLKGILKFLHCRDAPLESSQNGIVKSYTKHLDVLLSMSSARTKNVFTIPLRQILNILHTSFKWDSGIVSLWKLSVFLNLPTIHLTNVSLTMPKPLIVWVTINCGKFWKRWEYQTTSPAAWETCMQVRKQQLELTMEPQTGSK